MPEETVVDNLTPEVKDNASPEVKEKPAEPAKESNWFDSLEPDLKNDPSITKFKDPGTLAKSYRELQKLIGKDKIVVPTDKSTPQEWAEFYKKVGRPDDINAYELAQTEMPEEIKMRKEVQESFKKVAYDLGLTKKQFSELSKFYDTTTLASLNQEVESLKSLAQNTETSLRKEWGAAYESKVDSAQKVINKFFTGKNINKAFNILSSDIGFVKAMSEVAAALGEDSIKGTPRFVMTPIEAKSELNKILGDSKHPYHNDLSPEHNAAVDRVIELQQMASV
jgi:hypothetical protein